MGGKELSRSDLAAEIDLIVQEDGDRTDRASSGGWLSATAFYLPHNSVRLLCALFFKLQPARLSVV